MAELRAPKIGGKLAVLDVDKGQMRLTDVLDSGYRVPVILHGYVEGVWGSDDRTSMEFEVKITRIETKPPERGD